MRFETEVRLKGDFVDDLIGGRFSSEDSLLRRASFLGCDLSRGVTVVVADVDEFEKTMAARKLNENEVQRLKARFFNRSTRLIAEVEPSSLVSLKSDRVIIFLSGPGGAGRPRAGEGDQPPAGPGPRGGGPVRVHRREPAHRASSPVCARLSKRRWPP